MTKELNGETQLGRNKEGKRKERERKREKKENRVKTRLAHNINFISINKCDFISTFNI